MSNPKLGRILCALFISIAPLVSTASPVLAAAPTNDNFANATLITSLPFHDSFTIDEATTESGEPIDDYCFPVRKTVWYKFAPATDTVVNVDSGGSYYGATALIVLEAQETNFGGLNLIDCINYGGRIPFYARGGKTYYIQLGSVGRDEDATGAVNFNMMLVPPPPNDNFANAIAVTSLPFDEQVDITGATREPNEPTTCCDYAYGSIWYSFSTPKDQAVTAFVDGPFFQQIGIYTGNSVANLTKITCTAYNNAVTFQAKANTTYYIQASSLNATSSPLHFALETPPPPQANFYFYPTDPSIFDTIQFNDSSSDPAELGIQTCQWQFGDRKSATGCNVNHTYAKDGSYTTQLSVTTIDGRTATTSQVVSVKTHDVAIVKFTRPSTARAGRTYKLVVGVSNKRYPEDVTVELLKSTPQTYEHVGTLKLRVPVRSGSHTTDFYFSYTFTEADAHVGKVTFKAIATLVNGRDALPADNEFISFPTKVSGKTAKDQIASAGVVVEDLSNYVTDYVSNPLGIDAEAPTATPPAQPNTEHRVFMPLVNKTE